MMRDGRIEAARWAARAADSARTPQLPLTLPLRRRLEPAGWRETKNSGLPHDPEFHMCRRVCSRPAIIRVGRNLSRAPTASLRIGYADS